MKTQYKNSQEKKNWKRFKTMVRKIRSFDPDWHWTHSQDGNAILRHPVESRAILLPLKKRCVCLGIEPDTYTEPWYWKEERKFKTIEELFEYFEFEMEPQDGWN